jgi:hypothetical protein
MNHDGVIPFACSPDRRLFRNARPEKGTGLACSSEYKCRVKAVDGETVSLVSFPEKPPSSLDDYFH